MDKMASDRLAGMYEDIDAQPVLQSKVEAIWIQGFSPTDPKPKEEVILKPD